MNKMGIICSSLLLIIILLSIGIVSANDNNVDIAGISFNIPSEYNEKPDFEIKGNVRNYGNMTITENHKTFCDKDGKYLGITVEEFSKPTSLKDLKVSGDEKTIGSVKGIFSQGDLNFFKYEKDNKIVTVSYDDESIIESVIN